MHKLLHVVIFAVSTLYQVICYSVHFDQSITYVQFTISLTFLRSIFIKITANKRSSDSLVVDFLKIARQHFFLCLYKVINFVCSGIWLHG